MTELLLTAAEWAQMMRSPLRDNAYRATRLGASVVDFLAWKRIGGAADRTLDQYERDLARACILYPDIGLAQITADQLVHVLTTFPAGSRRRAKAALSELFRWAYQTERRTDNPMLRLPAIPQTPQKYIEVLTPAEQDALVSLELRDGALMMLLLDTGIRKAEARHLTAERADPERGEVIILRGKGQKDRVIPMTRRLRNRLNDLYLLEGIGAHDHLWYTRRGNQRGWVRIDRSRPAGEGTFHRWWERCTGAAGVDYRPRTGNDPGRANPHVTRHTFALNWLRGRVGKYATEPAGRPGRMETLAKAMGHASVQTTIDLYGHLDLTDVRGDLALIEGE